MNVVLVIIDSLRKDHVGVYGNGWIKTPNMDALAEESLRFTRPYPEAIPSIPARHPHGDALFSVSGVGALQRDRG
jgi:arylsulfatase A-like enzyme